MNQKLVYLAKPDDFSGLSKELGVSPATLKILADRGIRGKENVTEYLNASMDAVPSGEELKDMVKGVKIIDGCVRKGKKIRIMGDYDVDGVTSTYILYTGLKHFGADVDYFIPDRIKDGYGLHESAIRDAYADGVEVILTCDNGISAYKEIELANSLGMTTVVTDHHEVPYEEVDGKRHYLVPPAAAVVDPKLEDSGAFFREICGGVVAWKFMGCMYRLRGEGKAFEESDFLEMASLATVCDVMELLHENRSIVKAGLKKCKETKNLGLRCLIKACGLEGKDLNSYDYGFKIGPCINAAGRLKNAKMALELFLETDTAKAEARAAELATLNDERQRLTQEGMEQAFRIVDETMANDRVLVVLLPDLHESIAGIVAGKVRERYNRPSFVLTKGKDGLKGSGRSIEGYAMYDELVKCKDLLRGFGGHALAAGLSLKEENLEAFRLRLNGNCLLTAEQMVPKIAIDVIMPVDYLSESFIKELDLLEPFGKGNEKPVFAQKHMRAYSAEIIGKDKNVLRINLASRNCRNAVCFGSSIYEICDYIQPKLNDFSLVYYPQINEYNGYRNIQAVVTTVA